jgi:hypothetical protein
MDVDWQIDVGRMRAELQRIVEGTDLWDGRTQVLQVTDAVGGLVRVRALVTAVDAGTLFDLRCHVREHLVSWVQRSDEAGVPRVRAQLVEGPAGAPRPDRDSERSGVFSGDVHAERRGEPFRRTTERPED